MAGKRHWETSRTDRTHESDRDAESSGQSGSGKIGSQVVPSLQEREGEGPLAEDSGGFWIEGTAGKAPRGRRRGGVAAGKAPRGRRRGEGVLDAPLLPQLPR